MGQMWAERPGDNQSSHFLIGLRKCVLHPSDVAVNLGNYRVRSSVPLKFNHNKILGIVNAQYVNFAGKRAQPDPNAVDSFWGRVCIYIQSVYAPARKEPLEVLNDVLLKVTFENVIQAQGLLNRY